MSCGKILHSLPGREQLLTLTAASAGSRKPVRCWCPLLPLAKPCGFRGNKWPCTPCHEAHVAWVCSGQRSAGQELNLNSLHQGRLCPFDSRPQSLHCTHRPGPLPTASLAPGGGKVEASGGMVPFAECRGRRGKRQGRVLACEGRRREVGAGHSTKERFILMNCINASLDSIHLLTHPPPPTPTMNAAHTRHTYITRAHVTHVCTDSSHADIPQAHGTRTLTHHMCTHHVTYTLITPTAHIRCTSHTPHVNSHAHASRAHTPGLVH